MSPKYSTSKRTPAPVDYARRVELLHRYGIQVNGSFVLGFDHDGPDVFARTVEWIAMIARSPVLWSKKWWTLS